MNKQQLEPKQLELAQQIIDQYRIHAQQIIDEHTHLIKTKLQELAKEKEKKLKEALSKNP